MDIKSLSTFPASLPANDVAVKTADTAVRQPAAHQQHVDVSGNNNTVDKIASHNVPDADYLEAKIKEGDVEVKHALTVGQSAFTLFKMPDGKTYSRVRNLDTGEIKYYPSLESSSYAQMADAAKGTVYERKV